MSLKSLNFVTWNGCAKPPLWPLGGSLTPKNQTICSAQQCQHTRSEWQGPPLVQGVPLSQTSLQLPSQPKNMHARCLNMRIYQSKDTCGREHKKETPTSESTAMVWPSACTKTPSCCRTAAGTLRHASCAMAVKQSTLSSCSNVNMPVAAMSKCYVENTAALRACLLLPGPADGG